MRFTIVLCLMLAACASRGKLVMAPEGVSSGWEVPVFVATTRALDEDGTFGTRRSEEVSLARYDVSIPPVRREGAITWPGPLSSPDPLKHFLTKKAALFPDQRSFGRNIKAELAARDGVATVFIHGFNYNFAESLYRVAQFGHDLNLPGVMVEYAWPSAASPLGYVHDRDSALFARNGLEQLLDGLRDAGAREIVIVAHSMGTVVATETLRQIAIRGDRELLDRLGGVILISPDLDVDLFRSMARDIAPLPEPFVIFGSDRDRVLRLSALMTGQSERLGSLSDVSKIADLKITFLDVGEFSSWAGHFEVGDNPALIALLRRIGDVEGAFEADRAGRIGLIPGAVLTVQNATRIVLSPIGNAAAAQVNQSTSQGQ